MGLALRMIQGVSVFSGRNIPKGSGTYRITSGGHSILTASRKEKKLVERKINPRDIRWTALSRKFLGKETKHVVEKMDIQKTKVVRGFKNISASSMSEIGVSVSKNGEIK